MFKDVLTESVPEINPAINQYQPNYNNTSQNLDTNRDSIIISNLELFTSRDYSLNPNHDSLPVSTINTGAKNLRLSSALSDKRPYKSNKSETPKRHDNIKSATRKKSDLAITVIKLKLFKMLN